MALHPDPEGPAADLRALIARHQIPLYHLAPLVGVHPFRLGQMLRGKIPFPPDVVWRLPEAVRALAAAPAPVLPGAPLDVFLRRA